jgi:hypothetical protein
MYNYLKDKELKKIKKKFFFSVEKWMGYRVSKSVIKFIIVNEQRVDGN